MVPSGHQHGRYRAVVAALWSSCLLLLLLLISTVVTATAAVTRPGQAPQETLLAPSWRLESQAFAAGRRRPAANAIGGSTEDAQISFANHKSMKTLVIALLATLSAFVVVIVMCVVLIVMHEKGYFGHQRRRINESRVESELLSIVPTPLHGQRHASSNVTAEHGNVDELSISAELQALVREVVRRPSEHAAAYQRIEELILLSLSRHERMLVEAMAPDDRIGWIRHWRRRLVREERMLQRRQAEERAVQVQPSDVPGILPAVVDGYLVVEHGTVEDLLAHMQQRQPPETTDVAAPRELLASRLQPSRHRGSPVAVPAPHHDHCREGDVRRSTQKDVCGGSDDVSCRSLLSQPARGGDEGAGVVVLSSYGAFTEVLVSTPGDQSDAIRLYRRAPSEYVYGGGAAYLTHGPDATVVVASTAASTPAAREELASLSRASASASAMESMNFSLHTGLDGLPEPGSTAGAGGDFHSSATALDWCLCLPPPPPSVSYEAHTQPLMFMSSASFSYTSSVPLPQDPPHHPGQQPLRAAPTPPPLLSAENFLALVPYGAEQFNVYSNPTTTSPPTQHAPSNPLGLSSTPMSASNSRNVSPRWR